MIFRRRIANLLRLGSCLCLLLSQIFLPSPVEAFTNKKPTITPKITLVTRGIDFLKVQFQDPSKTGTYTYQYSLDAGRSWFNGVAKWKSITVSPLSLTTRAQVSVRAVNKFGAGAASPPTSGTRVIFIGASITQGYAGEGHGWAQESASALGWQYTNFAVAKSGFIHPFKDGTNCKIFRNFLTQISCAKDWLPDIVVISGGYNDCNSADNTPLQEQARIENTFQKARTLFPRAEIITTPVITTSTKPCLSKINGWLTDSSVHIGARHVLGAEQWLAGKDAEFSVDGIHPNRAGHALVSKNFLAWYRAGK